MHTNHPERKRARAQWFYYNSGLFFVTICTKNRKHYFGTVVNGKMQLTEIGHYADLQLQNATTHYPYAEIPVWVVMPNHLHAIVTIRRRAVARRGPTTTPTNGPSNDGAVTPTDDTGDIRMRSVAAQQGWLSVCIGGIKSAITRYANLNDIPFAWQPGFHDHIIRNTDELNRITAYIQNNPKNWESDCFL